MSDAPTLSEISYVFNIFVNSRYASCVATALLAYDYVLTMGLEINHIWSQPFSSVTMLYLINRYGYPLVVALELVQASVFISLSDKKCNVVGRATEATIGVVAISGLAIFTLRTWSLYLKSWKILAFVGLFAVAKLSVVIASFTFVTSYEYLFQIACTTDTLDVYDRYAKANNYLSLAFDTVVFVLTIYKSFRSAVSMRKLGMTNSVTFWLLRDGFIYYIGRILLVVFDIVTYSFPTFFQYDYSLEILNAVANIMINHLLLNLRHVSTAHSGGGLSQKSLQIPEVAFASDAVIGNIGAPLSGDPEEFTWPVETATETGHSGLEAGPSERLSTLQAV